MLSAACTGEPLLPRLRLRHIPTLTCHGGTQDRLLRSVLVPHLFDGTEVGIDGIAFAKLTNTRNFFCPENI